MLVEFSLKPVYSTMVKKIFNFMFIFHENTLNLGIFYSCPTPPPPPVHYVRLVETFRRSRVCKLQLRVINENVCYLYSV